jgi:hypothetical protein
MFSGMRAPSCDYWLVSPSLRATIDWAESLSFGLEGQGVPRFPPLRNQSVVMVGGTLLLPQPLLLLLLLLLSTQLSITVWAFVSPSQARLSLTRSLAMQPFSHHARESTQEDSRRRTFEALLSVERAQHERGAVSTAISAAVNTASAGLPSIVVAVRQRPLNEFERRRGELDVVSCAAHRIVLHEPRTKFTLEQHIVNHAFVFDRVFGPAATSGSVYRALLGPHISRLDRGGCVTMFAYGQTGSGKTYTMSSLIRRTLDDVFALAAEARARGGGSSRRIAVCLSAYELYCNAVYDLLAPGPQAPLPLREDASHAVQVSGLTEHATWDARVARAVVAQAAAARHTGSTRVNAASSRSHAVLQVLLREEEGAAGAGGGARLIGKVTLVDLAGSEQASEADHPPTGGKYAKGAGAAAAAAAVEAAEINRSLLALKECIRAMGREATAATAAVATATPSVAAARGESGRGGRGLDGGGESEEDSGESDWGEAAGYATVGRGRAALLRQQQQPAVRRRPLSASATSAAASRGAGVSHTQQHPPPAAAAAGPTGARPRRPASAAAGAGRARTRGGGGDPDAHSGGRRHGRLRHVHVPFRGSKLTHLLRDSFTAPGAVTIMLATIGPGSDSAEHSLNTLRYAARLKRVAVAGGEEGEGAPPPPAASLCPPPPLLADPTGGPRSVARRVGVLWNGGREVWPDGTSLPLPLAGKNGQQMQQWQRGVDGSVSTRGRSSTTAAAVAAASVDPSPASASPIALALAHRAGSDAPAPPPLPLTARPPPPALAGASGARAAAVGAPPPSPPQSLHSSVERGAQAVGGSRKRSQQEQGHQPHSFLPTGGGSVKSSLPLGGAGVSSERPPPSSGVRADARYSFNPQPALTASSVSPPATASQAAPRETRAVTTTAAAAALDTVASLEEQIRQLTRLRDRALQTAAAASTATQAASPPVSPAIPPLVPPPPPALRTSSGMTRSMHTAHKQLSRLQVGGEEGEDKVGTKASREGSSDVVRSVHAAAAAAASAVSAAAAATAVPMNRRVAPAAPPFIAPASSPPVMNVASSTSLRPLPATSAATTAATGAEGREPSRPRPVSASATAPKNRAAAAAVVGLQSGGSRQQATAVSAARPHVAVAPLQKPQQRASPVASQAAVAAASGRISSSRSSSRGVSKGGRGGAASALLVQRIPPPPPLLSEGHTTRAGESDTTAVAAAPPAWMPQPLQPRPTAATASSAAGGRSGDVGAAASPVAKQQRQRRDLTAALLLRGGGGAAAAVSAASAAAMSLQVPTLSAAGHWR